MALFLFSTSKWLLFNIINLRIQIQSAKGESIICKKIPGLATGTVRRLLYVAWILVLLLVTSDDADAQTATKVTPNRLIQESSPYLLQHATNPVDWYPWGEDAFEKARKEDKPIFLSIGYSTCHWCHVMEHESFADEEVAALLNQYFVSVKVDREERPDIDQVYMAVTQTMTGREILAYILRDMTSKEGGFYSAEDADSEGVEGKFYLWTLPQIQQVIGKNETEILKKIYNLEDAGNFKSQEAEQPAGSNILHLKKTLPDLAGELGLPEKHLLQRLEKNREQLFMIRKQRVHPFKDDKILTDWNGLMIAALARAGLALDEPRYTSAAVRAADFIMHTLRAKNGRLLKRYRKGDAGLPAHLNDYAFVVWGFLELYEASFKTIYLQEAIRLNNQMIKRFWDHQSGGLFMTADDGEKLLIRNKAIYDGAIPSGNSVAVLNLLRLGHITGNQDYLQKAGSIGKAFSGSVNRYPQGHAHLMVALEYALHPNYEVVIAGKPGAKDTRAMLAALRQRFLPGKVVVLRPADTRAAAEIIRMAPYTQFMVPKDGKATAYVCTDFVCKLPTTDISQMLANLQVKGK